MVENPRARANYEFLPPNPPTSIESRRLSRYELFSSQLDDRRYLGRCSLGRTATELEAARRALGEVINKGSYDELARRLDRGLGEYIGNDDLISVTKVDKEMITAVRHNLDGSNYRVILPENEFPELYELKAKQIWLKAEFIERRNREFVAAQNAAQDLTSR